MTRTLRRRHRRMFLVIGVLLPIMFVAGIAARRSVPVSKLPPELASKAVSGQKPVWQRTDLFTKVPTQVRLSQAIGGVTPYSIELIISSDFAKPDLLVYWVAGTHLGFESLPSNARLLGGASGGMLLLPEVEGKSGGVLVLYSLADGEIVGISKPVTF